MMMLVMDSAAAAALAAATSQGESRLEPRQVSGGAHAGEWALPEAVLSDPAFADLALDGFALVEIDPGEAWVVAE